MVLENLFHGSVFITPLIKSANQFSVTMFFQDEGSQYKGYHAQIGDYVYLRVQTGRFHRLKVSAIESKDSATIVATLTDEDATIRALIPYNGAIIRETPNMKLPLFTSGISKVLLAAIKTHLAILIDQQNTEGGGVCQGLPITRQELTADVTFCVTDKDGNPRKLSLKDLVDYVLIRPNAQGDTFKMGVIGSQGQFYAPPTV